MYFSLSKNKYQVNKTFIETCIQTKISFTSLFFYFYYFRRLEKQINKAELGSPACKLFGPHRIYVQQNNFKIKKY